MIRILYIILCLHILSGPLLADDKNDAREIVKQKLDAVFAVLQKSDLDRQAKKQEINAIVTPMFDFELMAKLTLGKKHWPGLPRGKKEKFTELYIELLKTSYLDKLALYTDEKVIFEPPAQVKTKVHVPTQLVSKDRKTSIMYKLYKPGDDWKVYDLEIQGVSIIRSYRTQFSETLKTGTIDDLLLKMERPEKPAGS
jgi:phospholipid transport system substrate-binding protein